MVTAVTLTAAQVYFTVQNYKVNKLRFIDDVQQSLNSSIENYFANKAKNDIFVLSTIGSDTLVNNKKARGYVRRFDNSGSHDSMKSLTIKSSAYAHAWATDLMADTIIFDSVDTEGTGNYRKLILNMDSSRVEELQFLTQKVMVSISEDLLDLGELYEVLKAELQNRNLEIDFALQQESQGRKTAIGQLDNKNVLSVKASSAYLGRLNAISIDFENATLIILKNGIIDLVLSFLLIALVIGTLIHLYRIIYSQKQLAAIKDDLISNITHEFKTPIATIFSALEGVTSFNEKNDLEKTKRYLTLSNDQLHKLNDMVEKMLETATIDQGKLSLSKEETEVVAWTKQIVDRFALIEKEKEISFQSNLEAEVGLIDRFHLENALSNLIDNAIKYGGDVILVELSKEANGLAWEVKDNGGNIPRTQREKVFDKLYRIPTGNQHDVKGFGIGLYYARNIAETHGGTLTLDTTNSQTVFKLKI